MEELYHSALALPEAARAGFLAQACHDDAALRAEVESLLRHSPDDSAASDIGGVAGPAFTASLIGRSIGCYRVESLLGAGGMGIVYRARDTQLGRTVAIKVLPAVFASHAERMARFDREARVLAAVNHPNIATIHGIEEDAGVRAIVMELVDGETLEEKLEDGPLGPRDTLLIARQIADALDAAHEKGIVHRDLKPANVKITPDGTVKVLDFGLASAPEEGAAANTGTVTRPGLILGTAAYMSPEQARGLAVDKRTDIWAFGCLVYEMLTGRRPFDGATASDVIARVITQPPDFGALPASTPEPMVRLLQRCLEKDIKQRLRDIGDARAEIAAALAPGTAAAHKRGRMWFVPAPKQGLAYAAVAVFAVAGTWLLLQREPALPPVSRVTVATTNPVEVGVSRNVAMSRDGSRFTFRTPGGFVVGFTDGRPEIRFADPPGISSNGMFFSPDGEWVGYSTGGALYKVSLAGGDPINVVTTAAGASAAWGPDGIVFTDGNGLSRVAVEGGPPEKLPMAPIAATESLAFPELLPDGRTVLVTVLPFRGNTVSFSWSLSPEARVDAVDMRTGARKTVITGGAAARLLGDNYLVYVAERQMKVIGFDPARVEIVGTPIAAVPGPGSHDFGVSRTGSLIYFPSGAALDTEAVWVDRSGAESPLGAPVSPYVYPRLSPDNSRVAFVVVSLARGDRDVWVWDIARRVMTKPIEDGTDNPVVAWTADGAKLAFGSARSGGVINTFWQAFDGSGPAERLLETPGVQMPIVFAPDGRLLLSADAPGKGRNILALSVDGTRRLEELLAGPAIELTASFSPDGRWVAYDATDSGSFEIYVRPYPDVEGGRWVVSRGGGRQPLWSPDGRELFYRDFDGAVMSVGVTTTPSFRASPPVRLLSGAGFRGGGAAGSAHTYAVANDGRFLMLKETKAARPAAHLVLNWTEELARLLPR